MKKYILLTLITVMAIACDKDMEEFDKLKASTNIQLVYLDAQETENTSDNPNYISNRKILKEFSLDDATKKSLVKTLMNKDNYEPKTRKCRFEPVYAVKVDGALVALFDVEYCPSLQYFKDDGATEIYQLKTESELKSALEKLTK
jgi:hypothetical protein